MKAAQTRPLSLLKGFRGFSILEVLVVITVLGIVATVSVGLMSGIKDSADQEKLQHDIQTLNDAVRIYEAMGGSLDGATEPQQVIDKLKTVVNAELEKRMPGLTGSMIDPRLSVVTTATAPGGTFAEWNPDTLNFELVDKNSSTQAIKIERFGFGAEPAVVVTEARDPALLYSKDDTWVWDYQDRAAATGVGPTVVSLVEDPGSSLPPSTSNPPPPTPPGNLDPPEFSIPGGGHPDTSFPLSLTLSDPNPGGASEIIYWVNSDPPAVYSGPISLSPDDSVTAFANSMDDDLWNDSGTDSQTYTEVIPPPDIDFSMSVTAGP